jgi:mannose-1-phosphate guanylyltransferase
MSRVFPVIMAGGRGTRFWPASTISRPKQFMNLLGGGTMLELTAARFGGIADTADLMVVASSEHGDAVRSQLPLLRRSNLLLEPVGRNTAACIGWAALTLARRGHSTGTMVVAASDHRIEPAEAFESTLKKALKLAESGSLCTIGIVPDHPATGYGYIRKGAPLSCGFRVDAFREKPDETTAAEYLQSGEYLWNSGMFVWRVDVFLEQFALHLPDLHALLREMPDTVEPTLDIYGSLESVSIDCGLMERTDRAVVVPSEFSWSDIGDWPGARKAGVSMGRSITIDSPESMVFDETGRLTVLMGVPGVTVVSTDSAILVMADESAQKLKNLVERLKDEQPDLV